MFCLSQILQLNVELLYFNVSLLDFHGHLGCSFGTFRTCLSMLLYELHHFKLIQHCFIIRSLVNLFLTLSILPGKLEQSDCLFVVFWHVSASRERANTQLSQNV
jgi:hypothetical protein